MCSKTALASTGELLSGSLSSMIAAATAISAGPASTMDRVPGSAASRPLASGTNLANSTSRARLTAPESRINASSSVTAASAASRRCGSVMISCHRYRRRISWNQRCWSCSIAKIRASHSRCSTTAHPAVSSFRKPGIRSRGGGSVNAASMIAARCTSGSSFRHALLVPTPVISPGSRSARLRPAFSAAIASWTWNG